MEKDHVPQDQENLNEGKLAKLYYATDDEGHYVKVNSVGWEPETVAMQQAWDVVFDEVDEARKKVLEGKASPLLYYIKKNIMTHSMVGSYVSTFGFMVRLHCRPYFFKKLSREKLEKYAYTFRISVEELLDLEQLKKNDR